MITDPGCATASNPGKVQSLPGSKPRVMDKSESTRRNNTGRGNMHCHRLAIVGFVSPLAFRGRGAAGVEKRLSEASTDQIIGEVIYSTIADALHQS